MPAGAIDPEIRLDIKILGSFRIGDYDYAKLCINIQLRNPLSHKGFLHLYGGSEGGEKANMKDREEPESEMTFTTKQLSEMLELSPRRVQQLADEGVLVKAGRGHYDAVSSIRNYLTFLRSKLGDENIDLKREQALHERAKRELAEIKLSVVRGDVHRSDDVKLVMNDMIAAFRSKVLNIPAKIAPQLVGMKKHTDIQHLLMREVRDACTELSEYDPHVFYSRSSEYVDVNDREDDEE